MKRILVTGCNGQLGRSLQLLLSGRVDCEVLYTDLNVADAEGFASLDITDYASVKALCESFHPDYIVNCAAYTAVDKAESEPELCAKVNSEAPAVLAKAASETGVRLIHISTDYVFDGTARTPIPETAPTNPQSVYGHTKLKGEQAILSVIPDNAVILRTAWLYSPFGHNFVKTMLSLASSRSSIGVVADQHGCPTYAPVLAEAIMRVIDSDWQPGIYNFTGKDATTWYDFTCAIFRLAGISNCEVKPLTTEQYPTAAVRPAYSVLSTDKFTATYNFEIPDMEESLKEFFKTTSNGNN